MPTIKLTNKEAKELAEKVIPKIREIRWDLICKVKKEFADDLKTYKKFNWRKFRFETHRRTDDEIRVEHERKMEEKCPINHNDYMYSWRYHSKIFNARRMFESELNLCNSITRTKDHHQIKMDVNMYGELQQLGERVVKKHKKTIL